MSPRWCVAVALVVGVALMTTVFAIRSSPVQAQRGPTENNADRLGGVRFVFHDVRSAEDEAARADAVKKAGVEAGWTESRIDRPGTITLLPPPSYQPDMFGDLLDAIQEAHLEDVGIQLLDGLGRATDDQGRPIE